MVKRDGVILEKIPHYGKRRTGWVFEKIHPYGKGRRTGVVSDSSLQRAVAA